LVAKFLGCAAIWRRKWEKFFDSFCQGPELRNKSLLCFRGLTSRKEYLRCGYGRQAAIDPLRAAKYLSDDTFEWMPPGQVAGPLAVGPRAQRAQTSSAAGSPITTHGATVLPLVTCGR
jgi:hypothetical protein